MDKLDFVSQNKDLYTPPSDPQIVDVPAMQYLMFDGLGTPEDNPLFQKAFQALYGVAYGLKFMPRKGKTPKGYQDFKVPPPEGLWWVPGEDWSAAKPNEWRWTLMLRVPDFVTLDLVDEVITELVNKKKDDIYTEVYLQRLQEGPSVQLMHVGPYDTETADINRMIAYARHSGYHPTGKHHEIYFGDPRRTRPEKLKTVLRHPVTMYAG